MSEDKFESIKKTLGSNIKHLREASGLHGDDFSKLLGISRQHLWHLETGKAKQIHLVALWKLAEMVKLDNLLLKGIGFNVKKLKKSVKNAKDSVTRT